MKRVFLQKQDKLDFKFYQNVDDFVVTEQPIKFTGKGNFIILKMKYKLRSCVSEAPDLYTIFNFSAYFD